MLGPLLGFDPFGPSTWRCWVKTHGTHINVSDEVCQVVLLGGYVGGFLVHVMLLCPASGFGSVLRLLTMSADTTDFPFRSHFLATWFVRWLCFFVILVPTRYVRRQLYREIVFHDLVLQRCPATVASG